MIPFNTANQTYMVLIFHEFRSGILGRSQIFVAFDDNDRCIRQSDHDVKAGHLGAYGIIKRAFEGFEYMHDHGSDGRFTVTSCNDNALFIP